MFPQEIDGVDVNTYIRDLCQDIALAYDLEELKDLVHDLGLDWDELPG